MSIIVITIGCGHFKTYNSGPSTTTVLFRIRINDGWGPQKMNSDETQKRN